MPVDGVLGDDPGIRSGLKTKERFMNATMTRPPRRWAAALLVLVALGVAACGSNSSGSSTKSTTQPTQTSSSSAGSAPSSTSSSSSSNGIPQGPNAGDDDGDNHGGPSDGDGNI